MKKEHKFNPNLGMDMPEFLAGKPALYMTKELRKEIWKEVMAEPES